jgi:hypothetical protein
VHRAVNRVQMLIDAAWDVFICGAGFLIGFSMLRHPAFGRIFGGTGMDASAALLCLNLDTFPRGPACAGSVDLGPLLAAWFLVVYARSLWLTRSPTPATDQTRDDVAALLVHWNSSTVDAAFRPCTRARGFHVPSSPSADRTNHSTSARTGSPHSRSRSRATSK